MNLSSDQHFAACHLIAALKSDALVSLLRNDVPPRSPAFAKARLRLHEAASPNFIGVNCNRLVLLDWASDLANIVAPKGFREKTLKRLRVGNLDGVESVISSHGEWYFNRSTGLGMTAEWFRTREGIAAPKELRSVLSRLTNALPALQAVISAMRYESREVSCDPSLNGLLLSYLDQVMPLLVDYHNDALTHDREWILKRVKLAQPAFFGIRSDGAGTYAAPSLDELRGAFRENFAAVFRVTHRVERLDGPADMAA